MGRRGHYGIFSCNWYNGKEYEETNAKNPKVKGREEWDRYAS
ncbi:hypothetical protein ABWK33_10835 [Bacillus wiedmannii]